MITKKRDVATAEKLSDLTLRGKLRTASGEEMIIVCEKSGEGGYISSKGFWEEVKNFPEFEGWYIKNDT